MKSYLDTIQKLFFIYYLKFFSFLPIVILALTLSAIDVLSIGLLIPLFTIIISPELFLSKFDFLLNIQFFNLTLFDKSNIGISGLLNFSLFFLLVFFIKTIFGIVTRGVVINFGLIKSKFLQGRLFSCYQSMNFSQFKKKNHSDYTRNINELSAGARVCLDQTLIMLQDSVLIISISAYLLYLDPQLMIVIFSIILFTIGLYNQFFKSRVTTYGILRVRALQLIYKQIDEALKGFKEVYSLNKASFFKDLLSTGIQEVYKNDLKSSLFASSSKYILEFVLVIFVIFVLNLRSVPDSTNVELLPVLAAYTFACLKLLPCSVGVSTALVRLTQLKETVNILFKDLVENEKLPEKLNGDIQNFDQIKVSDLNFSYANNPTVVLKKVNLEIKKGQLVGLVGKTGSGKTTLVDILLGLLEQDKGEISIDGEKSNLKKRFFNNINYLPQDSMIINDTIEKNITLSIENKIDKQKLNSAILDADLFNFISSLENGTLTKIGPSGINLSGGQAKKISLARMFYHNKDILILDEPTNSLDSTSEKNVMTSIQKLKTKKTILFITHNHENLIYCDKVYSIEGGKVQIIKDKTLL